MIIVNINLIYMKLKLLLSAALFLMAFTSKAQNPDAAQAIVHYKFSHLQDSTKRDSLYTENMTLIIGRNASAYKSLDRQRRDENIRQQIQEQMANAVAIGGAINLKSAGKAVGSTTEFYQFSAEKKLVRKEKLMVNTYLISEALPVINWKISSDTASFSGLHCQKATAHFKGRDYVAWFCADMPYHTGPWKLNGLPGLIIEAADTKNEVLFKFAGLERVADVAKKVPEAGTGGGTIIKIMGADESPKDPGTIALPTNGIAATEGELARLKEAVKKDPNAYIQSAMAASGISGTVSNIKNSTIRNAMGKAAAVINNPIELSEKK